MATAYIQCSTGDSSASAARIVVDYTQSITNNTTTASFMLQIYFKGNYGTYDSDSTTHYFKIDNVSHDRTNKPWDNPTSWTNVWTSSYTQTFTHNTDGTKDISVYLSYNSGTSRLGTVSCNTSFSFPDIARASKIGDISTFYVEDTFYVPITKYSSSFTDNLAIKIGSTTIKSISNYISNNAIKFTPEENLKAYNLLNSSNKATFTFVVTTKSGTTTIGSDTATVTGIAAGNVKMKINGVWGRSLLWIKIDGIWKRALIWVKISGTWRRGD